MLLLKMSLIPSTVPAASRFRFCGGKTVAIQGINAQRKASILKIESIAILDSGREIDGIYTACPSIQIPDTTACRQRRVLRKNIIRREVCMISTMGCDCPTSSLSD